MEEIENQSGIKKKLVIALIVVFILIVTIILYSRYIGTTGLIIKEYKITNSKVPSSFYGFKIVHLSDVHYGRTIYKKELKKVVDHINLLKPDIVVLTGDLLDSETVISKDDMADITKELKRINSTIGKFAITGEHDYNMKEWSTIIKNSNFINLNDTYELIYKDGYEPILLAGLSTNLKGTKNAKDKISPINEYISSLSETDIQYPPAYKILLMHEPDYIEDITYKNYDLILAGHSHNGQVRFPFMGAIIKPKGSIQYYDEYYQLNHTDFYISSGLGTMKYDFRLFNRPSINFYRLTNK